MSLIFINFCTGLYEALDYFQVTVPRCILKSFTSARMNVWSGLYQAHDHIQMTLLRGHLESYTIICINVCPALYQEHDHVQMTSLRCKQQSSCGCTSSYRIATNYFIKSNRSYLYPCFVPAIRSV